MLLPAFANRFSRIEDGVEIVPAGIAGSAVYEPLLCFAYEVSGYPNTNVPDGDDELVAARTGDIPRSVYRAGYRRPTSQESNAKKLRVRRNRQRGDYG
jgi:hypothetical protein